jgi:four helix bundle protein
MKDKGILYNKSKELSLQVIQLCKWLQQHNEYIISNQIIRSATSVGANYSEALGAESPTDFIHKISISLKELYETQYWLELLHDSNYINNDYYNQLYSLSEEVMKMMTASILTKKKNISAPRQP